MRGSRSELRGLLAVLVSASLVAALSACGEAATKGTDSRAGSPHLRATSAQGRSLHERLPHGHKAGPVDRQAIAQLLEQFFALAAKGDGGRACRLLVPSLLKAAPIQYGRYGAPYLRGARTCQAVLSREFTHQRPELTAPIVVLEVDVEGDRAYALLRSKTLPLSFITPRRLHGVWMLDELMATPLQLR